MPRNGSGVASVVNTFVPLTTADANAVNTNFDDVADMITDSLPRDGQAGMTGQFLATSGTVGEPGISWNADPDTGIRRPAGNQMAFVCGGADVATASSTGLSVSMAPTVGDNLTNKSYVDAISVPTGSVTMFASGNIPSGWLRCNGQAISRTTYSSLFAVIGTIWGVGDGSTTFNLPDMRGEFVRGFDEGRGVDPGRVFAVHQAESTKAIPDPWLWSGSESTLGFAGGSVYAGRGSTQIRPANWPTGTETRPRNVTMIYIIKI